ncbi:uncharacterized protein LOC123310156 [Coccinella septempunctata]|uniref:uncharacterized protein LOC123310156 n=1 Tax=Coccinella septempunctata TaxID=41139 RepID=UPI001D084D9C|nr:uncharacterized protein LOC123310156 [Coccinella septempunctata]
MRHIAIVKPCLEEVNMLIPLLFCVIFVHNSNTQHFSTSEDVKALSELPLERLLLVQRSFEINDENLTDDSAESRIDFPGPVALRLKNPSRGGYEHEHEHYEYDEHDHKKGGKDVKNFFQLAVTALAFLAFGGYLLCLIVQAIKSKHMDQMTQMANMQMMAAILKKQIARKRTSRPRRTKPTRTRKNNGGKKRPRRETGIWPDADPEKMYYALVSLSEAYTNQHTIDYKNFNRTAKFFN